MNKMVHILSVRCDDLTAQVVKTVPAMRENWVQSLGWEDPQEEGMATHSSILAWGNPVDIGALWVTVHRVTKSRARLSTHTHRVISGSSFVLFLRLLRTARGILVPQPGTETVLPLDTPEGPLGPSFKLVNFIGE